MADKTFALVRLGGPSGSGDEPLGDCTVSSAGDTPADDDVVTCTIAGMGEWTSSWGELARVLDGHEAGGFTLAARPDPRDPDPAPEQDAEGGHDA